MVLQPADVAKQQCVAAATRHTVVHVATPDVTRVHVEAHDVERDHVDVQRGDQSFPGVVALEYADGDTLPQTTAATTAAATAAVPSAEYASGR